MTLSNILIIEPNLDACERFKSILSAQYSLHFAHNRLDAIQLYEQSHLKVRIVLLNLALDDDEESLLLDFRRISQIPDIIVYSECENIREAVYMMKNGATNYLSNPYDESALLSILDSTITQTDIVDKLERLNEKSIYDHVDLSRILQMVKSLRPSAAENTDNSTIDVISDLIDHQDFNSESSNSLPKLLIVEDEETYQFLIKECLGDAYDILLADTCEGALRLAENNSDIQVVLLDVFLPDGSGADIISELISHCPGVQIIVVTAFEFVDIAVNTLKSGAVDYLNKPFVKDDLLKAVQTGVEQYYVQKTLPKLTQSFIQDVLSEGEKTQLLDEMCQERRQNNRPIYMADVYLFFPHLRNAGVPAAFPLPDHVLDNGIQDFISNLANKISKPI